MGKICYGSSFGPSTFRNSRNGQASSDPFFKHWIWPIFEVSQMLHWSFLALIIKKSWQVLPACPSSVLHWVKGSHSMSSHALSLPFKTENRNHGCCGIDAPKYLCFLWLVLWSFSALPLGLKAFGTLSPAQCHWEPNLWLAPNDVRDILASLYGRSGLPLHSAWDLGSWHYLGFSRERRHLSLIQPLA